MARILFVDDDIATLQLMGKAAEMLGHLAILCASAQDSIEQATQVQPDLIIIDQQLHDMDGTNLIVNIRRQSELSLVPIYLVSAYLSEQDQDRACQSGATGILQKPVSLTDLAGIVALDGPGHC